MAIYMIAESTTKDPEAYAEYQARVPDIIAKYGGRYIVRGGEITPGVGGWTPERIIVLEFDFRFSREYLPNPKSEIKIRFDFRFGIW